MPAIESPLRAKIQNGENFRSRASELVTSVKASVSKAKIRGKTIDEWNKWARVTIRPDMTIMDLNVANAEVTDKLQDVNYYLQEAKFAEEYLASAYANQRDTAVGNMVSDLQRNGKRLALDKVESKVEADFIDDRTALSMVKYEVSFWTDIYDNLCKVSGNIKQHSITLMSGEKYAGGR